LINNGAQSTPSLSEIYMSRRRVMANQRNDQNQGGQQSQDNRNQGGQQGGQAGQNRPGQQQSGGSQRPDQQSQQSGNRNQPGQPPVDETDENRSRDESSNR
jgi:hypothetical protein